MVTLQQGKIKIKPTDMNKIKIFTYNGFGGQELPGFAPYTVESFIKWTNDPGIGLFKCSNGQDKLIPTWALTQEYCKTLPTAPVLKPFEGFGVLFGESSNS